MLEDCWQSNSVEERNQPRISSPGCMKGKTKLNGEYVDEFDEFCTPTTAIPKKKAIPNPPLNFPEEKTFHAEEIPF